MDNVEFRLSLVDGSMMPREVDGGAELISLLFGGDFGPPAKGLVIVARTDDGQTVRIGFAADNSPRAHVSVEIVETWVKCRDCDNGTIYVASVPDGKHSTRRCDTCGGLGRVKRSGRP